MPRLKARPGSGSGDMIGLANVDKTSGTSLAAEGRPLYESTKAELTNLGWCSAIGDPASTWYLIERDR